MNPVNPSHPDQLDLNLTEWPQDLPLRPVEPVPWEVVDAHFRPWVELVQARPGFEEERLRRKVYVPFVLESGR